MGGVGVIMNFANNLMGVAAFVLLLGRIELLPESDRAVATRECVVLESVDDE